MERNFKNKKFFFITLSRLLQCGQSVKEYRHIVVRVVIITITEWVSLIK